MPFPFAALDGNHPTRPARRVHAVTAETKLETAHDHSLVKRFLAGDQAAFDEIIVRHREKLFAVACALLRDKHDAEEIVQDAFVRAFRGLHRFRGECSLATWLHRITVNLSRNRYWYFYRRRRHASLSLDRPLSDDGNSEFSDLIAADTPTPRNEAMKSEFGDIVVRCMDQLEPSHREILTLRNTLHRSYGEIARELGINEGTVKSRIARARGCLRNLMAKECPEFPEDAAPEDWLERDVNAGLAQTSRSSGHGSGR
jgi:RNA polymerase sigma-70 factor (ECF subfamily)